ncbi:beta strand repeat-containing protein [Pedobacter arcticus]|uniref:beta strand repeat-containing protein n=1 Tax=Pedobacter arcticus TaxID=752140 RepID=UPI0003063AE2|nr:T9SS type A sorting domain-containing protein [Pedobacter arcticus]
MMRKLLFTTVLMAFAMLSFGQTTYYWVGGTTDGNINTAAKWNTQLDGLGATRASIAASDILIIDGANIGGNIPITGVASIIVNTSTTAQVKLKNNASVVLLRASSSGSLTIANNTPGEAGLTIDASSSLQLGRQENPIVNTGSVYVDFPASTASILGKIKMVQGGATGFQRITSRTVGAIIFEDGSSLEYDNVLGYPFGTPGGGTSNSSNYAIVFKSGASLINNSIYSPFGNNSASSIVDFKSGSNYYVRKTITTGSVTNSKTFANVFIENGSTLTTDASIINKIENLTIDAGSNFSVGGTSNTQLPITGNLIVNGAINVGTYGAILVMGGSAPQSISGTGSIKVVNFVVADKSSVTLDNDVDVSVAVNVFGKLNFKQNRIKGDGTFASRVNFVSSTGATQAGAILTEGSYQITVQTNLALSALQGLAISGTGIPVNTNIVSYSSGNGQINLSKPATVSATNVTLTFGSNVATLTTSNTNGFDDALGSVVVTGTKNYEAGTNFILNAATSTPFSIINSNDLGDVTFNAAATTNRDVTINGKLTLNNAKLTIRNGDNLTMGSSATFDGTFGNMAYIATEANTSTGIVGTLKLSTIASVTQIPIGTTLNYTPISITPAEASDFSINVFQGATTDATPNGTAFTATQKNGAVDAIWNINRTSGTGNCDLTFAWNDALEGSSFSGSGLGVANYTGGAYGAFAGTASETTNTATVSSTTLGQFLVGKPSVLPVTLISFTAKNNNNNVALAWQATAEVNLSHYIVQRSTNGVDFTDLTIVEANNTTGVFNYAFLDRTANFGTNYYQLISVDTDGKTQKSELRSATLGASVTSVKAYPNPAINQLNVSGLALGDIIKMFNTSGQLLISQNAESNQVNAVNMTTVKPGIYILSIENAGKVSSSYRIVKQ